MIKTHPARLETLNRPITLARLKLPTHYTHRRHHAHARLRCSAAAGAGQVSSSSGGSDQQLKDFKVACFSAQKVGRCLPCCARPHPTLQFCAVLGSVRACNSCLASLRRRLAYRLVCLGINSMYSTRWEVPSKKPSLTQPSWRCACRNHLPSFVSMCSTRTLRCLSYPFIGIASRRGSTTAARFCTTPARAVPL